MMRSAQTLLLAAAALLAGVTLTSYSPGASSQPATIVSGSGDDLRAAFANALEVAEGKRVAQTACAGCHGAGGISITKGVPHLAGQRPAYLHLELRAYKSGARANDAMGGVVKFMSDDALLKVAAFYSSMDPAQSRGADGAKAAPARPDPVQSGKAAAAGCAGCHGEIGVSRMPGMPSLVGLDPKYLVAAMQAYKSGQRKHDVMKSMLATLSDAEQGNVALFYALQMPARASTPSPGDQAAGKAAAGACAGCHGDQGVSSNPATPSLAGQDAEYFAAAMRGYKDGSRSDETMKGQAASLDAAVMKNLAAFYANQSPRPTKATKPLTTVEWAQRCDRCHGTNGQSTDPRLPALAGQREEYLAMALQAYRSGARKSTAMAAMSGALTDADIENLAAHYARQKARAMVYVILPGK